MFRDTLTLQTSSIFECETHSIRDGVKAHNFFRIEKYIAAWPGFEPFGSKVEGTLPTRLKLNSLYYSSSKAERATMKGAKVLEPMLRIRAHSPVTSRRCVHNDKIIHNRTPKAYYVSLWQLKWYSWIRKQVSLKYIKMAQPGFKTRSASTSIPVYWSSFYLQGENTCTL